MHTWIKLALVSGGVLGLVGCGSTATTNSSGGATAAPAVAQQANCVVNVSAPPNTPLLGGGTVTLLATGTNVASICNSSENAGNQFGTATYHTNGDAPSGSAACTYPDSKHPAISWKVYSGSGDLGKNLCSLSSIASSSPTPSGPTKAEVQQWPAKWCTLQIGMTRAQVKSVMGTPTGEFGPDTSTPQASWSAYDYQFNAFFDITDHVKQLDINDYSMTASEKAQLGCATERK
jgi:hypothetical protein